LIGIAVVAFDTAQGLSLFKGLGVIVGESDGPDVCVGKIDSIEIHDFPLKEYN